MGGVASLVIVVVGVGVDRVGVGGGRGGIITVVTNSLNSKNS
jgi:hypothetical protein